MHRRAVVVLVALLLACPGAAGAQPAAKVSRIGYLSPLSAAADARQGEAFRQGLRALGHLEGQNVVIEARHADGHFERLPALAAELVRLQVDVIVAAPTPAVRAVQRATRTIPIVMAFSGDPVGEGFAAELARPGGNVTGLSAAVAEMAAKRVEFLRIIAPHAARLANLTSRAEPRGARVSTEIAGRDLGFRVETVLVDDVNETAAALAALRRTPVDGLVVSLTLRDQWKQIVDVALKTRLPTVSGPREFAEIGGLMAYGPSFPDLFRRAATYVDKILKGAWPGDLPVEQPSKFEFVINRRTARALGLAIPEGLLLEADQVID